MVRFSEKRSLRTHFLHRFGAFFLHLRQLKSSVPERRVRFPPAARGERRGIAFKTSSYSKQFHFAHSSSRVMRKMSVFSGVLLGFMFPSLKLHLPFKSSSPSSFSSLTGFMTFWRYEKAANADVTDLICSRSPSAQQTQSLRCSATWAAKDKAPFFFFGQPSQSFLGLPGLAARVQMCGNWVWNRLFEVELPPCSSVIAILPIFSL